MSDGAYLVTKDVRHLAVWTRNHEPRDLTGRYRPICGEAIKGRLEYTHRFFSEDDYQYAMRRPICRRCLKVVEHLRAVALDAEAEDFS